MNWKKIFKVLAAVLLTGVISLIAFIKFNPEANRVYNEGYYKAQLRQYNEYLAKNPNDGKHYYERGEAYEFFGETEKAQADFAKARELGYEE